MKLNPRFVGEWEEQFCTILALPHINTDWKPYIKSARNKIMQIAKTISKFQKVVLLTNEKIHEENILTLDIKINDTWCRDYCPISLVDEGRIIMLDFVFNGWGLKYKANFDNQVSKQLPLFENAVFESKNFILEGGSIDSNGGGILLTTKKCLLESNRNNISQNEIEDKLKQFLNVKKILWLESGFLEGDDTNSHIDNLARFINENTIVYMQCEDKNDLHYKELKKMEEELREFRDINNLAFNLIPLPMPVVHYKNNRLPASYINFLFINNAIILPSFGLTQDLRVAKIFNNLFPNREIIQIESNILIKQGGGIHCSSMNIPKIQMDIKH